MHVTKLLSPRFLLSDRLLCFPTCIQKETKEDKKMNNYPNSYGTAPNYNYQQIQQMFPQPQGSVYAINTPTEIGNVPIGSTGLSVAICFNE